MPIQYRCRCGQEVVLRPREGYYVVAGLILGACALNLVLSVFLWLRLDDVGTTPVDPLPASTGSPATVESPLDPEVTAVADGPDGERDDDPSVSSGVGNPADGSHEGASHADGTESDGMESEELKPAPTGDEANAEPRAPIVEASPPPGPDARAWTFDTPASMDGLGLWITLDRLPPDPGQAAAVLLAGASWGSGHLRTTALRAIQEGASRSWALDLVAEALPVSPRAEFDVRSPDSRWSELHAAWGQLGGSWREDPWITRARASLAGREDCVLLLDLSSSMEEEIQSLVAALRFLIPMTVSPGDEAGERRRWGWIGYRDEVVERFDLTSDGDAFLESLGQLRCDGGGDVPEGVDRAVFEALRFGRFQWQKGSARRLLVIGDAPPPYERVEPLLSMTASAHRSPEAYQVDVLGIVREPELGPEVPAFRRLSEAGGGQAWFVEPGGDLTSEVWRLIAGPEGPGWGGVPPSVTAWTTQVLSAGADRLEIPRAR